jgi:hypothetical protein
MSEYRSVDLQYIRITMYLTQALVIGVQGNCLNQVGRQSATRGYYLFASVQELTHIIHLSGLFLSANNANVTF